MPSIRLNNCNIYYETFGAKQKPVIVLLHAFPLDHNVWKPQAKALSSEYYIVTPDFRGHGQSEATVEAYSMDLLASDVKALIDSLGLRNIVLGGISMGGYVAFAYARLFPEDLRALLLVDTKAEADTSQARMGRMEMADTVRKKGVSAFADQMLPRLFSKESMNLNNSFVQEARKIIEAMNPVGIVGGLKGLAERADSTPLLERSRVPTLIIAGEEDQITTPENAKTIMKGIVGSKLVIIPKAGHISTLEQPEKVTSAIQTFLKEIPLSKRPVHMTPRS
ncbi:MAG TPA: alpha/beta fold hydrolase [Candidatus Binatus sp.]|nr:alpha/beta fold hydrolase [Candidatus Binatus sp.]